MSLIKAKLTLPLGESKKIVKLVQRHLRILYRFIGRDAQKKHQVVKRILTGGTSGDGESKRGMAFDNSLTNMFRSGRFISEMGFSPRYDYAGNLQKSLMRSLTTKSWRSSRTIRLMRIGWYLDYNNVVNTVKYKIESGKGKNGYMHWLEFIHGDKPIPNYKFMRMRDMGNIGQVSKKTKLPRAFFSPGVGRAHAGFMIKDSGKSWTSGLPIINREWYQENIIFSMPPIMKYWKKRIELINRRVLLMMRAR